MRMLPFRQKVLEVVARIPRGQTLTYQQVAWQVGHPRAARAVGSVMRQNYDPAIPCHRVIRSDGKIGNYNRGGPTEKARRLEEEGAFRAAARFA